MKYLLVILVSLSFSLDSSIFCQGTKIMDESVYTEWNVIRDSKISANGDWMLYSVKPDHGDKTTVIYNTRTQEEIKWAQTDDPTFDYSGRFLYFLKKPAVELVREQKRNKTEDDELATDTLFIYDLKNKSELIFPSIANFEIPDKAASAIVAEIKGDKKPKKKKGKSKKQHAQDVIYINPETGHIDTLENVIDYVFAKESPSLFFSVKSDSIRSGGVFIKEGISIDTTFITSGKIYSLTINNDATQAAFLIDTDTTDILHQPYELFYWNKNKDSVNQIVNEGSDILPENWSVSDDKKPSFSDDGTRLFFGATPKRLLQDTSKIDEEIVNVEVWHYQQAKLYTQQELDADDDENKSYDFVYFPETNQINQLQGEDIPDLRLDKKRESKYAMLMSDLPYKTHETWQGYAEEDIYKVNVETGETSLVANAVHARIRRLSPSGKYIFWYNVVNGSWVTHNNATSETHTIANSETTPFSNELHDTPSNPFSYGIAGWSTGEEFLLAYDRYDIWQLDPTNNSKAKKLTNGRQHKIKYRYISVDEEEDYIDINNKMLVHVFDETDKSSGYGYLDVASGEVTRLQSGDYYFTTNITKARNSDDIFYTKQSFTTFPNLIHDKLDFKNPQQVSDANPQQTDYAWGDNEIYKWTAFDGQELNGILALPPGFDKDKKYPLLVNFYERSSDRIHRHRAPSAGRSTINYSFYTNRGYVIFNPDVPYKIGDPGESCYNAVISGVAALIAEGFIDKDKIGVQGHSWGGYQVAHLVTKTNIFACAESGAPLVNMISAYGGIRWGTGYSRQFQYEKTQSRLGATLWESPERYIRNSPLFNADKIETPVLIMHNDADGHVPWHLGIEFFMALRRLQKPSWFLNYNGEPHWPLKWQNRLDFNIRMQQFFDHYLMDAPMPVWMKEGIPAIEKGIREGYEIDVEK